MSYPVYYVEENDTLPHVFDTFDGGTGASITLTGLATTDIEIYKDGNVTAGNERGSDSGFALIDTDGIDLDSMTGIHGFTIDLSDNSDAGFYAVGSWYHVIVNSVTIDSQTVRFVACAFRIVSATRGMAGTALPAAAAGAAGGVPTSTTGLDTDDLIAALGAIDDAAAAGDPSSAESVMQYVKQLVNILVGTAGVTTFPAEAAPGDGVSLAEVLRAIHADVTGLNGDSMRGTDSASTHSANDVTGGTTVAAAVTSIKGADGDDLKDLSDEIATAQADLDTITGTAGVVLDNNAVTAASTNADFIAEIATEISDALTSDTISELSQGAPANTPTIATALMALYMALINKTDWDGSNVEVHNAAGTVIFKKAHTNSGGVYSQAKAVSG